MYVKSLKIYRVTKNKPGKRGMTFYFPSRSFIAFIGIIFLSPAQLLLGEKMVKKRHSGIC